MRAFPEGPDGASEPGRWVRRIGLALQFLLALLVLWPGVAMQSCVERGARQDRSQGATVAAAQAVSVAPDEVDRRNDGRLVHVVGPLVLEEPLADPELGIAVDAAALERRVEMYQWQEEQRTTGIDPRAVGRDEYKERGRSSDWTVYQYTKRWSDEPLELTYEKRRPEHNNPIFPAKSAKLTAELHRMRLGTFRFSSARLPAELTEPTLPLIVSPQMLDRLPLPLRARAQLVGTDIFVGNPSAPAVGDLRISYRTAPLGEVTVIGEQDYWGLRPRSLPEERSLFVLKRGRHSAEGLLQEQARALSETGAWPHVFGFPFFFLGALLAYWPFRALSRVAPAVDPLVAAGALAFVPLVAIAVFAGNIARLRWEHGVTGAGMLAVVSISAAGTLLVLGARRRARAEEGRWMTPPGAEPVWYYADQGTPVGPLRRDQLELQLTTRLPGTTLVWHERMPRWVTAASLPELAGVVRASAPPAAPAAQGSGGFDFGEVLKDYFLWPVLAFKYAFDWHGPSTSKRSISREQFLLANGSAVIVFLIVVGAAVSLVGEADRMADPALRIVAGALALLGVALAVVSVVGASAARLRDIGESSRRSLLMLVPGVNVILWFRLLLTPGVAAPAAAGKPSGSSAPIS